MNIHEIKSYGVFHEYVPMGSLFKKKNSRREYIFLYFKSF